MHGVRSARCCVWVLDSAADNLLWLCQFNEKDPDSYFLLFERVCKLRRWSEEECAIMGGGLLCPVDWR